MLPMPRFRPRISLISALLLLTIAGMAIVVVQLWREVGPLREEVHRLRNETGRLFVDDKTKLHAIQVETDSILTWKWRVWIPDNQKFNVYFTGENIPEHGFPQRNRRSINLTESGEQVITYRIQRDPRSDRWQGNVEAGSGFMGGASQPWVDWPSHSSMGQYVGRQTVVSQARRSTGTCEAPLFAGERQQQDGRPGRRVHDMDGTGKVKHEASCKRRGFSAGSSAVRMRLLVSCR